MVDEDFERDVTHRWHPTAVALAGAVIAIGLLFGGAVASSTLSLDRPHPPVLTDHSRRAAPPSLRQPVRLPPKRVNV